MKTRTLGQNIIVIFMFVVMLGAVKTNVYAVDCSVVYDPAYLFQVDDPAFLVRSWLFPVTPIPPQSDPDALTAYYEHMCGQAVSCDPGQYCLVGGGICPALILCNLPYTIGDDYDGECKDTSDICRAPTGGLCLEGYVPCSVSTEMCVAMEDGFSRCRYCANDPSNPQPCNVDAECCDELAGAGVDLVCDTTQHTCVAEPPPPAFSTCDPAKYAIGEVCDYAFWGGDDISNYCANCVGGPDVVMTDPYGNRICTFLADGVECTSGCSCASGVCNDDGSGTLVCSNAITCVDTVAGDCGGTNPDCCSVSSGGDPLYCDYTVNKCYAIPGCGTVVAGDTCSSSLDCCPATTGLSCDAGGHCVMPVAGSECTMEGQCAMERCDYGQMCVGGLCEFSDNCIPTVLLEAYDGPIISFDDLMSRAFLVLYPIGIGIGLFTIAKSGYTIMTSEGNPAKISEGKEQLTAAVIGTFFILLSLVILRVIIRALLGATL